MSDTKPTTKKFSKGERSVPHHSQKASKFYPSEDVAVPKKVSPQFDISQHHEEYVHSAGGRSLLRTVTVEGQ